ncbi:MAG: signal peptide peptidase SppA [Elusimicrobia bacterium]|nr:signal peptide peptidase SppA [Elusimicrobiota bacterium]
MSMEEPQNQNPQEPPAEAAASDLAAAPPPSPEPPPPAPPRKRRLIWALVILYFAALAAAVVLLIRPSKGTGGTPGLDPGALLAVRKEAVGWVGVSGAIYQSESSGPWGRGSQSIVRRLKNLAERKDVKAIVLDINSPGGSVGAVQEIHSQIERIRREKKKPVVALMGDIAASGGYYLAAGCDRIVAHPGTLTGSIGVIFHVANVEGLFSKLGVKSETVKSGKMKDIGSMTRAMTKEERELLQALIDDAYGQFLKAVSDGRGMPQEVVKPLADGRIFTGAQALESRLVDELGDSQRALELAAKLGKISGKPEVVRDAESFTSLLQLLDGAFGGGALREAAFLRSMRENLSFSGLEYRWR